MLRTKTEIALMASISALPCLAGILENYWGFIVSSSNNVHGPRKLAGDAQSLAGCINRGRLHFSNDFLRVVVDDNIELVIVSYSELIALMLDDMLQQNQILASSRELNDVM